jgi:hypothetical protein
MQDIQKLCSVSVPKWAFAFDRPDTYCMLPLAICCVLSGCITELHTNDAVEANAAIWSSQLNLPTEATHIDIQTSYKATLISFDVSKDEFMSWCASKGWDCRQIPTGHPISVNEMNQRNGALLVERGLFCEIALSQSDRISCTYDEERGRGHAAYISD